MSITAYLSGRGFVFERRGKLLFTNSPFNPGDKTPSFAVYDDVRFKCYSTGKAGNLVTLQRFFGDKESKTYKTLKCVEIKEKEAKDWGGKIPSKYLDVTTAEATEVHQYAKSRKLTEGYLPGVSYFMKEGKWERSTPGLLFPHLNDKVITGFKLRFITPVNGQRFTTRGKLGLYIYEQLFDSFYPPTLDVVEGEANALSLSLYYRSILRPSIVVSAGSVTSIPKSLPYKGIKARLLVDFDGDESKWQKRITAYSRLNLEPVKIILPKGEDINSLWIRGEMGLIENLL